MSRARILLVALPLLFAACGEFGEPAGADPAKAGDDEETCVGCHTKLNPGLVADLLSSPHENVPVTCEECHGDDHDQIFAVKGDVPPTVCARCHEKEWQEFARSRHGRNLREGKPDPLLKEQWRTVGSCTTGTGCHSIQKRYADGSIGRCGACHPTHSFSNHEARNPRVCIGCHEGTDNSEYRAWHRSAHSLASPSHDGLVADCVECHGTHDVSDALTRGLSPMESQNPPLSVPTLSAEEFEGPRGTMLARCRKCHGTRFARDALELADRWRRRGAVLLDEARAIVTGLAKDGLLGIDREVTLPNPATGHAFSLGPVQVFDESVSVPERIYYEMHFHLYPALWRAAYHTDPERVAWEANDALKIKLDELRDFERKARK
jgi:hypothetical protein